MSIKDQSSIFFSVIIPTYNRETELKMALKSVFDQTETDYEIIIIDDHSDDNTIDWLRTIKDPRLKVLMNHQKKGAAGARNIGVEASKGKWIAFLDSDDWWRPNKLEVIRKSIEENPLCNVFYSASIFHKGTIQTSHPKRILTNDRDIALFSGKFNFVGALPAVVMSREIFDKSGGFDVNFPARQDMDMYIRLSKIGKFHFINEELVEVSLDSENRISNNPVNRLNGWLKFYNKHKKEFSFSDKIYQQKRIFYYALMSKKIISILRFLPGYVISKFIETD